jgi:hypothetical protein
MFSLRFTALIASISVPFFAAQALAQTPLPPQPMQKPEATSMPAPTSAFAGYRMFSEKNPLINWRGANDFVEKLDGHMGHVRGAPRMMKPEPAPMAEKPMPSAPVVPATPAATMAPKPAPNVDHSKHEMKKP